MNTDFGRKPHTPPQCSLSSDSQPQSGLCSQGLLGPSEHLPPSQGPGSLRKGVYIFWVGVPSAVAWAAQSLGRLSPEPPESSGRPDLLLHGKGCSHGETPSPRPRRPRPGAREAWVCILALPLPDSMTLNNSFHLFDSHSPSLQMEIEFQIIY